MFSDVPHMYFQLAASGVLRRIVIAAGVHSAADWAWCVIYSVHITRLFGSRPTGRACARLVGLTGWLGPLGLQLPRAATAAQIFDALEWTHSAKRFAAAAARD